jgi:hypothetical protein
VLLPSDTHRNPITSITVVFLPFVTYLVTLPRTRCTPEQSTGLPNWAIFSLFLFPLARVRFCSEAISVERARVQTTCASTQTFVNAKFRNANLRQARTPYIAFFYPEDGGRTFLTLVTIYQTARCHFTGNRGLLQCSHFVHLSLRNSHFEESPMRPVRQLKAAVPSYAGSKSPLVLEEAKEMCGKGVRGDGEGKGVEGMRGAPLLLVFLGPTYSSIAGTVPLCSGNPPC